ncbi:hypothetical protein BH10PSE3_BH10PSE3_32420 [soil metagenome]
MVTLGFDLYFLIFPGDAPEAPGLRIPFLPPATSDLVVVTIILTGVVIWLCARGFGALLRALSRRPLLVANLDGLRFDPTLCREAVPWSDVRRIHETNWGRGPHKLAFDLRRRIWAVESPLSGRRVNIGGLHLSDNGWVTVDLIERLESIRVRASRDLGAAD